MKTTKLLALLLALSLLLAGCGGMATNGAASAGGTKSEAFDMVTDAGAAPEIESADAQSSMPVNQKLIRKIWLDAETEDMDTLLGSVEERIAQLGGYVEGRQVRNGSAYSNRRYRNADLTVRIPADKLDQFVDHVSGASNITNNRETTEDVTLSYVEHESKVKALETEQTRLLELLAKAESMEDILKIESRLTNIRTQLEQVKSQLRLYDNLVNYSTVYLNITEVKEYTQVVEPETLWERMGAGLADSWKAMVKGLENALVVMVVILPHLLPWAVIAAIVLGILFVNKKKKAKKTQPKEEKKEG